MLIDFGEVIVHVFSPDKREYYRLEELWSRTTPVVQFTGRGLRPAGQSHHLLEAISGGTASSGSALPQHTTAPESRRAQV